MKQQVSQGIILSRTDYGEADRILTLLTPDYGKVRLLAKGVRRVKSKLAGGIELFSVSTITFVQGRGDIGTLVSTRLVKHYGHIVEDLDRTMLGYELIKQLHKITEDQAGQEYFDLLEQAFAALDDAAVPLEVVRFWFQAQLLRLGGHIPNLRTDTNGIPLAEGQTYDFSLEEMGFTPHERGQFGPAHIKFLRLSFAGNTAAMLVRVQGAAGLVAALAPQLQGMMVSYIF